MKINMFFVVLLVLILFTILVTGSMIIPANSKAQENAEAPDRSLVIGDNWELERVDFIHYAKPENPGKVGKTSTCYSLMGVKWKNFPVHYIINPSNTQNLSEGFITSTIMSSAETWDTSTSGELFNNNFLVDNSVNYGEQDYKNSIDFADYPDDGVIAVTSVWYTRVGKQIVEFDQRYNTRFVWGDAEINPNKMDLKNIAVHELGHAVGLGDIYSTICANVTMYGYSSEGETSKRTLDQPDITGLQSMYGF